MARSRAMQSAATWQSSCRRPTGRSPSPRQKKSPMDWGRMNSSLSSMTQKSHAPSQHQTPKSLLDSPGRSVVEWIWIRHFLPCRFMGRCRDLDPGKVVFARSYAGIIAPRFPRCMESVLPYMLWGRAQPVPASPQRSPPRPPWHSSECRLPHDHNRTRLLSGGGRCRIDHLMGVTLSGALPFPDVSSFPLARQHGKRGARPHHYVGTAHHHVPARH